MNLFFWFRTAYLFLWRSGRSTLVISLMVLSAVCTLIFLSSLAVGVNDAMIENSVSLFSGHITGLNLSPKIKKDMLMTRGVAKVLKRMRVQGRLSLAGLNERVTLILFDPGQEKETTAVWKKITQGHYPRTGEQAVCLGDLLARRLGISAGNKILFSTNAAPSVYYELSVAGIFKTGIDILDRELVFCPMNALPLSTRTWNAAIFIQKGVDPESVMTHYQRIIPVAGRFKSWQSVMPDLRQLIDLNYISMSLVMVLVFGVVTLGISCAFVIFILKNIREYGIMKAMGVTTRETTLLITFEIILLNAAAATLGVILGILLVFLVQRTGIDLTAFTSHNQYFAVSGVIYPRLTIYSLWAPPALAFFFSLFAFIWPAMLVAKKKAAEILRMV